MVTSGIEVASDTSGIEVVIAAVRVPLSRGRGARGKGIALVRHTLTNSGTHSKQMAHSPYQIRTGAAMLHRDSGSDIVVTLQGLGVGSDKETIRQIPSLTAVSIVLI